jgi:uncharacterized protein YbjT (DUF2867 family)
VLVTGATGYVGSRLVPVLLDRAYPVRVLVRNPDRLEHFDWARQVEVFAGDLEHGESIARALTGADAAFYLVHSMEAGSDFAERDRRAAKNFIAAARDIGHVVYLGGLLPRDEGSAASDHLSSRGEVGRLLREALPTTEFRAGPVIGAGSASFEMVRHLTDRLPIMVAPRWVNNRIQCIGIGDVLDYMIAALEHGPSGVVEIGADELTFKEMMLEYASVRGIRRVIIPVPVLTPGLAAEWIQFVTPISRNMAVPIVKGMINALLADTTKARELFPHINPAQYSECVRQALHSVP